MIDVADPAGYLQSDYGCGGGYNLSHYCNAKFDEKLAKVAGEADPAKRYAVYAELAQDLQNDAVNIFVIHEAANDAYSTKVRNYKIHPLYQYTLTPELALE
jgi:peptide/nickel transport system substrate-binding protein